MTVDVPEQPAPSGAPPAPPISAHFVNNVLAAAASYIDEDPDYARDVLAELGQFLSYRLREDPAPVGAAQELAHTATFLRLQQARFPDRITVTLPDAADVRGRVAPGTIQEPRRGPARATPARGGRRRWRSRCGRTTAGSGSS